MSENIMGCDIRITVENYDIINKRWRSVQPVDGDGDQRNYLVFNILAGVRADTPEEMLHWATDDGKYHVSGPCLSGIERRPIAEPRGIPDDASKKARRTCEDFDNHSASWLTAKEILDHDWEKPIGRSGFINATQWRALDNGVRPSEWSQGIGGGSIVVLTPRAMRLRVADGTADDNTYARATWQTSPALAGAKFLAWVRAQVDAAKPLPAEARPLRLQLRQLTGGPMSKEFTTTPRSPRVCRPSSTLARSTESTRSPPSRWT